MFFLRKSVIGKLAKKGPLKEKAAYQYICLLHQTRKCPFQVNDKSNKRFNLDLIRYHVEEELFDFYCAVCVKNGCESCINNRRNMKRHLLSHKWKNDSEENKRVRPKSKKQKLPKRQQDITNNKSSKNGAQNDDNLDQQKDVEGVRDDDDLDQQENDEEVEEKTHTDDGLSHELSTESKALENVGQKETVS